MEPRAPKFLKIVAPDAQVNSGILAILEDFLESQNGEKGLGETIKLITGEKSCLSQPIRQIETLHVVRAIRRHTEIQFQQLQRV